MIETIAGTVAAKVLASVGAICVGRVERKVEYVDHATRRAGLGQRRAALNAAWIAPHGHRQCRRGGRR